VAASALRVRFVTAGVPKDEPATIVGQAPDDGMGFHRRLLLVLLAGPMVPALIEAAVYIPSGRTGAFVFPIIYGAVGYPGVILIGLPLMIWFEQIRVRHAVAYIFAGAAAAIVGCAFWIALDLLGGYPVGAEISKSQGYIALLSLRGAAGGLFAWFVMRGSWRRR
jgi:hypothetical protein